MNERFPSGEWTGFFTFSGIEGINVMNLQLGFRERRVAGTGWNEDGRLVIVGSYSQPSREIIGTLRYRRSNKVSFRGFGDGARLGGCWGVWENENPSTVGGGFHIWPVGIHGSILGNAGNDVKQNDA